MNTSQIMIEVLAGGDRCIIRGVEMNLREVVTHLRDDLKLKPGHPVAVRGAETVAFESIRALFSDLEAAGFGLKKAYY